MSEALAKTGRPIVYSLCEYGVPEKGADYYSIQDVPHGEVRERWYHSKHEW